MPITRENPSRPIVGVGAVVIKNNQVLLIQRGKPPSEGHWSLPGGAIELGEPVQQALKREIKEETGLAIAISEVIDTVDFIEKSPDGNIRFHYVLIDYLAFWREGTLKAGSDAQDAGFFDFDEALSMVQWDETKRILCQARDMAKTI